MRQYDCDTIRMYMRNSTMRCTSLSFPFAAMSLVNDVFAQSNNDPLSSRHDTSKQAECKERTKRGTKVTSTTHVERHNQSRRCGSTKQTNDDVANKWFVLVVPSLVRSPCWRSKRTKEQRERTTANDHDDLPLPSFSKDVMNETSRLGDIEEFRIAVHTTTIP